MSKKNQSMQLRSPCDYEKEIKKGGIFNVLKFKLKMKFGEWKDRKIDPTMGVPFSPRKAKEIADEHNLVHEFLSSDIPKDIYDQLYVIQQSLGWVYNRNMFESPFKSMVKKYPEYEAKVKEYREKMDIFFNSEKYKESMKDYFKKNRTKK